MSKVICEREDIVAIADAVRNKTGNSDEMTLGEIASGINGIEAGGSGGGNVETCTVTLSLSQGGIAYSYYTIENEAVTYKSLVKDSAIEVSLEIIKGSYLDVGIVALLPTYVPTIETNGDIECVTTTSSIMPSSSGGLVFKINGAGSIIVETN